MSNKLELLNKKLEIFKEVFNVKLAAIHRKNPLSGGDELQFEVFFHGRLCIVTITETKDSVNFVHELSNYTILTQGGNIKEEYLFLRNRLLSFKGCPKEPKKEWSFRAKGWLNNSHYRGWDENDAYEMALRACGGQQNIAYFAEVR